MEKMRVGELISILENLPREAEVYICMKDENVFTERACLIDVMCIYSGKADTEDVVLIYDC